MAPVTVDGISDGRSRTGAGRRQPPDEIGGVFETIVEDSLVSSQAMLTMIPRLTSQSNALAPSREASSRRRSE